MRQKLLNIFQTSILTFSCLIIPATALSLEKRLPENLNPGISYLAELVGNGAVEKIETKKIDAIIDFVAAAKKSSHYNIDKREGASGVYHEFDIDSNLENLLRYGFNPDIPTPVLRPSSVVTSQWTEVNGKIGTLPRLWANIENLDDPLILQGIESEEITPDTNTGGYYSYDLDKTIILLKHKGNRAFIVISRQKDISSVSKKGVVLEPDDEWNYFYSDEVGLTRKGLGWIKSYMYSSLSISVYYETNTERPAVRSATFKWLNAGWKGLNVVKAEHILKGLERYGKDFKKILEHPLLPEPEELEKKFSKIKKYSLSELKSRLGNHMKFLLKRSESDKALSRRTFAKILKNGDYLDKMPRQKLEGLLAIETMKCLLENGCKETAIRSASIGIPGTPYLTP